MGITKKARGAFLFIRLVMAWIMVMWPFPNYLPIISVSQRVVQSPSDSLNIQDEIPTVDDFSEETKFFGYPEAEAQLFCSSNAQCSDNNVCNGIETCVLGACLPGIPLVCNDLNLCNGTETCDPVSGCQAGTPVNCDDGDVCNGTQTCVAGLCIGLTTPLDCDDEDDCTEDTCDAVDGCINTFVDSDEDQVCDVEDNCPEAVNPNQEDTDQDGVGEACDNCPAAFNPSQEDHDNDGIGDACDCISESQCVDPLDCGGTEARCDLNLLNQTFSALFPDCETLESTLGLLGILDLCVAAGLQVSESGVCAEVEIDGSVFPVVQCEGAINAEVCAGAAINPILGSLLGPLLGAEVLVDVHFTPENPTGTCLEGSCCCSTNGGVETCDGVDNDCDGEVDEGGDALCGNNNSCDGDEVCDGTNGCQSGSGPNCDDGNSCTDDTCAPIVGCVHTPHIGSCDDGNSCTNLDTCAAGLCVGVPVICTDLDGACNGTAPQCNPANGQCENQTSPINCDDGVACTNDSCVDPLGTCVHLPDNTTCNDGQFCTGLEICDLQDGCQPGTGSPCIIPPLLQCDETNDVCLQCSNDQDCSDNNACNGTESCLLGLCLPGLPPNCQDGNACTADSCDPSSGCVNSSSDTDNDQVCDALDNCPTTSNLNQEDADHDDVGDACDNCPNAFNPDQANADQDALGDVCDCQTGEECTEDTECGGTDARCELTIDNNLFGSCDDLEAFLDLTVLDLADVCVAAGLELDPSAICLDTEVQAGVFAPVVSCGGAITANLCASAVGDLLEGLIGVTATLLINAQASGACIDNSCCCPTNGGVETCDGIDNNCDGTIDNGGDQLCSDGNSCNGAETCNGQAGCESGSTENCDDNNVCTDDTCVPILGCVHTPNIGSCDDGNSCTNIDTCAAGLCVGVPVLCTDLDGACNGTAPQCNPANGQCENTIPAPNCDDGVSCTIDNCVDPLGLCTHVPNNLACDDDQFCTGLEVCDLTSGCQPGVGNPCTLLGLFCDEETNLCAQCLSDQDCSDNNACNGSENCVAGLCLPGLPLDCHDQNVCTSDSCDPSTGCVNSEQDADDDDVCDALDNCPNTANPNQDDQDQDDVGDACDNCPADFNPDQEDQDDNQVGDACECQAGDECSEDLDCGGTEDQCNLTLNNTLFPDCESFEAAAQLLNIANVCVAAGLQVSGEGVCVNADVNGVVFPVLQCSGAIEANVCAAANLNDIFLALGVIVDIDFFESDPTGACLEGSCCCPTNNGIEICDGIDNDCDGVIDDGGNQLCSDGNACNGTEICDGDNGCQAGSTENCDDSNVCTDDSCVPILGCVHTPNIASCDDENSCTNLDTCAAGLCVGVPVICTDLDGACNGTAPQCNPANGQCENTIPAPNCDDGVSCTNDSCVDPLGICLNVPDNSSCHDGQFCTGLEVCDAQDGCQSGTGSPCIIPPLLLCDEANDVCVQCLSDADCTDGNACNGAENCVLGLCLPGAPPHCDDDNSCTTDSCDPQSGCVNTEQDADDDEVCDAADNCPTTPNPNQEDQDQDDVGDACDNCPADFNPDQADNDENNVGDACECQEGDECSEDLDCGGTESQCDLRLSNILFPDCASFEAAAEILNIANVCVAAGVQVDNEGICVDVEVNGVVFPVLQCSGAIEANVCAAANLNQVFQAIGVIVDINFLDADPTGSCLDGNCCCPIGPEVCDGIDNDCDGEVDEDLGQTTCGEGACETTVDNCVNGQPQTCDPGTPTSDANCNGVDDDCDGQTDEDFVSTPTECGVGACADTGETTCVNGVIGDTCTPGTPTSDANCNGVDDDCDGLVDDDFVSTPTNCGVGACADTGETTCVNGVIGDTCTPGTPTSDANCNGVDDDCDGQVDEEFVPTPANCGVGACADTGETTCVNGVIGDTCTPGTPTAEICNGIDDDCDSTVDEETDAGCSDGNLCNGTESCVAGSCQPGTPLDCDDDESCTTDSCDPQIGCVNTEQDADEDGVCDPADNCPNDPNPNQEDQDNDGVGDACDNCPDVSNPNQEDEDENQVGDACECQAGDECTEDLDCGGTEDQCDLTFNNIIFPDCETLEFVAGVLNIANLCVAAGLQVDQQGVCVDVEVNGVISPVLQCSGAIEANVCLAATLDNILGIGVLVDIDHTESDPTGTCLDGSCCCPTGPEICDGIDNDCDGEVDEDLGQTTCGEGACETTVDNCVNGQPQTCTPGTPTSDANCNGIDDDCDGQADDDFVSTPTECGIGACADTGETTCINGVIGDTCAPGTPTSDANCNGVDDDCDGQTDEDFVSTPTQCGVGECASAGETTCVNGVVGDTCTPGTPTSDANCNGLDDDCDGLADDDFVSTPTECGVGACSDTGATTCVNGVIGDTCTPGTPTTEVCNGIDDDCDGFTDEETDAGCSDGNLCNGTESCIAGSCQPGTPLDCDDDESCTTDSCDPQTGCVNTEQDADADGVCDAADNCPDDPNPNQEDGDNDEIGDACDNCPDVFNPNQEDQDQNETGDACECSAGDECVEDLDCGGTEDQCDLTLNNNLFPDCDTLEFVASVLNIANICVAAGLQVDQQGVCVDVEVNGVISPVLQCSGAIEANVCLAANLNSAFSALGVIVDIDHTESDPTGTCLDGSCCCPTGPEVCDGIDNDCDGQVDEDLGQTTCGEGACETIVDNCVNGQPQTCTPGTPTSDENCNGIDDDCDGLVDDDFVSTPTNCGVGACADTGETTCVNGVIGDTCTPGTPTSDANCNGIDDDCDGQVDDDFVSIPTQCGVGACSDTGATTCVNGVPGDTCTPGTPTTEICNGIDDDCDSTVDEETDAGCSDGNLCNGTESCIAGSCQPGTPLDCDDDEICTTDSCDPQTGCVNTEQDADDDDVCDPADNCPDTPNPNQEDQDNDGVGDACDNCPDVSNPNQEDEDENQVGDACECQAGDECTEDLDCGGTEDQCDLTFNNIIFPDCETLEFVAGVLNIANLCVAAGLQVDQQGVCIDVEVNGVISPVLQCSGAIEANVCLAATLDNILGIGVIVDIDHIESDPTGTCLDGSCCCPTGEEICDGIDNDCDGEVDEGLGQTTCGEGACERTVDNCVNGQPQTCDPGTPTSDANCNGVDDDCDGQTDEDFVSTPTECGEGACADTGETTCINGVIGDTCTPGTPTSDANCNGIDDDCDGLVDDDFISTPTNCGVGACADTGETTCINGVIGDTCTPGTPTSDANCNGIDEDCDGQVDDEFVSTPTNCGVGACADTGETTCVNGVIGDTCTPGTPTTEVCNGIDDDCDSLIDEETDAGCGDGNACNGTESCIAGSCQPGTPLDCDDDEICTTDSCDPQTGCVNTEQDADDDDVCDPADNCPDTPNPNQEDQDSDGVGDACDNCPSDFNPDQKDEDENEVGDACECQAGDECTEDLDCGGNEDQCHLTINTESFQTCEDLDAFLDATVFLNLPILCAIAGLQLDPNAVCIDTEIEAGVFAPVLTCGGELTLQACTAAMGDIFEGTLNISVSAFTEADPTGSCLDGSCCCPTGPEICDGIDNDCDGEVDEDLGQTTCGEGACEMTVDNCVNGQPQTCTPGTPTSDANCNGIDEDCDGQADDDFVSTPTNCGVGACADTGETTCVNGVLGDTCTPGTPTSDANCNGIDEDCDGQVDDDFVPTPTNCGVGACADTGETTCVGGVIGDTCTPGTPSAEVCNGIDDDCDTFIDEETDAGCSDGNACNGTESCLSGSCQPGTPLDCDDDNECTTDSCDPQTGCVNSEEEDTDDDDVCDPIDNCPEVDNPNQEDQDQDGVGDACDNCPSDFNPDQKDDDENQVGDACECQGGDECREDVDCGGTEDLCRLTIDTELFEDCDELNAFLDLTVLNLSTLCAVAGLGLDPNAICLDAEVEAGVFAPVVSCEGAITAQACAGAVGDILEGAVTISAFAFVESDTTGSCLDGSCCCPTGEEICDGIDNDCDGQVDEDLGTTPTTCGVGACADTGEISCVNGEIVDTCTPGTPTTEVCDGIDNDCDSQTDEDFVPTPTICGVGECADTGQTSCVNGQIVDNCTPGTPATEVCDGKDNDCDGQTDEGANECNDGMFCNGEESCVSGSCQPGTPPNCNDGVECTVDVCNEVMDCCDNTPNNTVCSDQNVCDGLETCDPQLGCQEGTPLTCDNGMFCDGSEGCDPINGCQPGTPPDCDDEIGCTTDGCNETDDKCDHDPVNSVCDDDDRCTSDSCDPQTGCVNAEEEDTDEDDVCDEIDNCPDVDNPNQEDQDQDGVGDACDNCPSDFNPDQKDEDDNQVGDACECHEEDECNEDLDCGGTDDLCKLTIDTALFETCDDLQAFLDATVLDLSTLCAVAGVGLDPNAICLDTEVSVGVFAPVVSCGGDITESECDSAVGEILEKTVNITDSSFTESDPTGSCLEGDCCCPSGEEICNGIDDDCDGQIDEGTNNACDDGNDCNGSESCVAGECASGTPLTCNDNNACTDDTCDPNTGCVFTSDTNNDCNDSNACNGAEDCDANGVCQPGAPLICNDNNACTDDSCNPASGCVFAPDTNNTCSDANACNGAEDCDANGTCQPGAPLICNDSNACTDDSCDPSSGCVFTPDTNNICSDGNVCNGAEGCDANGTCQPGTPLSCDNGQFCDGTESCDPANGCQPGTPPVCGDQDSCTSDSCNEAMDKCDHVDTCVCGDGNLDPGEECDGSDTPCAGQSPFRCHGPDPTNPDQACTCLNAVCGNFQVAAPEQCDDGGRCVDGLTVCTVCNEADFPNNPECTGGAGSCEGAGVEGPCLPFAGDGCDENCMREPDGGCTRTIGYWKTHSQAWCVDQITIGGVNYSKTQAINNILKKATAKDATYQLAAQLTAAKLNVTCFNSGGEEIQDTITEADAFLVAHPLGSNPQGQARTEGLALKTDLDAFNNSGEGSCDEFPRAPNDHQGGGGDKGNKGNKGNSKGRLSLGEIAEPFIGGCSLVLP